MKIIAIGDVHGNLEALERLLKASNYHESEDKLWFVGDLINRGPQSVECLKFVRDLGDKANTTLGNHDLSLLALAYGNDTNVRAKDDFPKILKAPEAPDLVEWLRHQKLLHHEHGYTMVHAGIHPRWTLETAQKRAKKVEKMLRSDKAEIFFQNHMFGNNPTQWSKDLTQWQKHRFSTNVFTRMRYLNKDESLEFKTKCPPNEAPNLIPWYASSNRKEPIKTIFGHWASLSNVKITQSGIFHLDKGCAWGGHLSSMIIYGPNQEPEITKVNC